MLPELLLAGSHLGQTGPHHSYADQSVPGKVHTFAENTTQDGKAYQRTLRFRSKAGQEGLPGRFIHAGFLAEGFKFRVADRKILPHGLQVAVAGKENQVVTGFSLRQAGDQVRNGRYTGSAIFIAGADIAGTPKPQMRVGKRTAQRHSMGVWKAAKIFIVPCRCQSSTEQHSGASLGEIGGQKGAGIQAKERGAHLTAIGGNLQNKMVVKCVRYAQPGADIKIELQQRIMGLVGIGVLFQPVLQGVTKVQKRPVQRFGTLRFKEGFAETVFGTFLLATMTPGQKQIVDLVQGVFQRTLFFAEFFPRVKEGALAQGSAVHFPGSGRQVVGFIHQEQIIATALEKACQVDYRVEEIVVIGNDHVTPQTQVQAQFEGTNPELSCQGLQDLRGQSGLIQGLPKGVLDAVVVSFRKGTGLRCAFPDALQAYFILGGQGDAA